jgi:simple sugar transport system ATP-binding protein
LDIGSTEFVYQQLVNYRSKGKSVLLISADLNEIMCLADRILVMYEGQIAGEVPGGHSQENTLGLMMTGAWKNPIQAVTSQAAEIENCEKDSLA